jgi:hypothetical protein
MKVKLRPSKNVLSVDVTKPARLGGTMKPTRLGGTMKPTRLGGTMKTRPLG